MSFEDINVDDSNKVEEGYNDLENKRVDTVEKEKYNELLESEVGISSSSLEKIAKSTALRRAFFAIAFSVGLFTGREALAQDNLEDKENLKDPKIENFVQQVEQNHIEQVIEESGEYMKNNEYFSKYPNSLMSWAAAIERPTDYQAEKILELHDDVSKMANEREFDNIVELMSFVNMEVDSGFSNKESYVKLKDIFPEEKGGEPRAKFDCDSRAIMVSSILQNMGYENSDFSMCGMEGHMVMYSQKEDIYFELTTNQVLELNREEASQINRITTSDKYFSHLLSNEGTSLALEVEGGLFSGYIDKEKKNEAVQKIEQAIDLDPDNLTAKLNLINLLGTYDADIEELVNVSESYKELLAGLVYNYHGIENLKEDQKLKLEINIGQELPKIEKKELTLQELSKKAIEESDYIRDKFEDYADFSYYKAGNYDEAIAISKLLLESLPENEKDGVLACMYRLKIINSHFSNQNFEEYISEVDGVIGVITSGEAAKYMGSAVEVLWAQKTVANILSDKLVISEDNIEDVIELYERDPVLGPIISGKEFWNTSYIEGVEMLKKWSGYEKLKELIKLQREKE
jgi:tetratricopeptide (TPR) repeat protein